MSDQETDANETETTPPTFAEQVNTTLALMEDDGTGKQVLPADLEIDEGLRYSVMAEKRRRDSEKIGRAHV